MKIIFVAPAVVLLTISILLVPACSSRKEVPDPVKVQEEIAEYRKQEVDLVRETVSDHERAGRLTQLLSERDRLISSHAKEIGAYRKQLSELNADYSADRKSFDILMVGYNSQRAAAQIELTKLIGAMKSETTPEEWKVISKFQLKRLNPRQLAYGQPAAGD